MRTTCDSGSAFGPAVVARAIDTARSRRPSTGGASTPRIGVEHDALSACRRPRRRRPRRRRSPRAPQTRARAPRRAATTRRHGSRSTVAVPTTSSTTTSADAPVASRRLRRRRTRRRVTCGRRRRRRRRRARRRAAPVRGEGHPWARSTSSSWSSSSSEHGERLAGAEQHRLHRALGDAEVRGDLADVEPEVVAQHRHLALATRERAQCLAHRVRVAARRRRVAQVVAQRSEPVAGAPFRPPPPHLAAGQVERDRRDPRRAAGRSRRPGRAAPTPGPVPPAPSPRRWRRCRTRARRWRRPWRTHRRRSLGSGRRPPVRRGFGRRRAWPTTVPRVVR